ncbi:MAG: metallophosphoesterase family protein [Pyrinomonadaceae bacterium]
MKFLHISDVHLGCTRYQLSESPRDFFDAWFDVLEKHAIAEKVEFVIICGDFFHKRHVDPQTMNHAFYGLQKLREAEIPVVVIEGNHDQHYNDVRHSWLRSLNDWGLIKLLEPDSDDSNKFKIWDELTKSGSFIDIGRARVFGSHWYGAAANVAIPMITKSIQENRRENAFHILMLHTDVEGHQTHPIPALSLANLKELKAAVEYVGLGHTHKYYEIDNWAFNPGSLEVTSIDEYREEHGAFLVEVTGENQITARHLKDYRQRPFQRLIFDVSGRPEPKDVTEGVLNLVKTEAKTFDEKQPIIEITLRGHLGFKNSDLEIQEIREKAQKLTDALHVRIKNHSAPIEYAVAADAGEDVSREELERRVIEDLIARQPRYNLRVREMTDVIIGAKRSALNDELPEKIVDFISLKLAVSGEQ